MAGTPVLACGDLHHATVSIEALAAYLEAEPHDAMFPTFNPALVAGATAAARVGAIAADLGPEIWSQELPAGDHNLLDPSAGVPLHCERKKGWQEPDA